MRVLTAAEMQACDRLTAEQFGVPSSQLMRNASEAVAAFAQSQFPHAKRVTVLCGRGNNGGDGMMTARYLAHAGLTVSALLLGSPDGLQGDVAEAWRDLRSSSCSRSMAVIGSEQDFARNAGALQTDLLIDAVVGTGFKPPLKGLALAALNWVKSSRAPILAIDLPSGWPANDTRSRITEAAFPADAVMTFTSPKPAHVFGELTRRWDQPIVVAPIGSPDEATVSELGIGWAGAAQRILHEPRSADANKGSFGHVLVVGGSFGSAGGKAGAPTMTALAAMQAGAGLVTAAVPAPALPVVSSYAPELMTMPLKATDSGEIAGNLEPEQLAALTKGITVLAIGPGMGQSREVRAFQTMLLHGTKMPLVIDADALNNLAASDLSLQSNYLAELSRGGRVVVLTPHPGEMARLAGMKTTEVQADRLNVARQFAIQNKVTLVLKGARTLIAHPDGRVAVNTTGNPGMAKGGSGDLLTGVIAGLLAQHREDPAQAVEAAVYLHGLAADLAVRERDEHTLLATDCLTQFSRAFRFRSRSENGYVWLQGMPAAN